MCDDSTPRCEMSECFAPAVGVGNDGSQLCERHHYVRQVPYIRQWLGDSWKRVYPVPADNRHLIGVMCVVGPSTAYPPGYFQAHCDVCIETDVIGPGEYPHPVCQRCRRNYERPRGGKV